MDTSVRILRVFLNRWLDKAESDADRTLRKLVEFGYYFSSSVPQKKFFSEAKKIISDSGCKYYELFRTLFSSADREKAIEFGIAFGYYGLAKNYRYSGERLFGREKSGPVAVTIPPQAPASDFAGLSAEFVRLSQNGAGVYVIFCDKLDNCESELGEIIDKNPRKAFFAFTSNEELAVKLTQNNVMPVLDLNSENYDRLSQLLINQKRVFGGFDIYGEESAYNIGSKEFLDDVYDQNCLFLFLEDDGSCSAASREKISAFSYAEKRKPSRPIFVSDILNDIESLNKPMPRKA